jgi:hypothetical protein
LSWSHNLKVTHALCKSRLLTAQIATVYTLPLYRILVGRSEGRRPLGRPRRRWEDNIKMDLQDVGWVGMDWLAVAQDRDRWRALVNAVMNLRVP